MSAAARNRGDVLTIAEQPQPIAQAGLRKQSRHVVAAIGRRAARPPPKAPPPATRASPRPVPDSPCAEPSAKPRPRPRGPPECPARRGSAARAAASGRNTAGSRPLPTATASREMCSRRASAASRGGDRHEDVGDPAADPFHGEAAAPTQQRSVLVEQEPVARIGHARHPAEPCRKPRQKAADRHMRVHQVGPLGAEQPHQGAKRPPMRRSESCARTSQRIDPEALGAHLLEQPAIRAHANHLVPACPHRPHQRQQELPEREIDIGDLDDLHVSGQRHC